MLKLNKKGFTLIELLVVIAIIGILASVTITSLGSAKNKAYKASAQSTVSALGTEFIMCVDDGGFISFPTSNTGGGKVICMTTAASIIPVAGHTAQWPSLADSKYMYVGLVTPNKNASSSLTFTLTMTGNVTLTCSWDGVADYKCK